MNIVDDANIVAAAGGFASIIGLVWLAVRGDPERKAEEDARVFFDRHGYWPDDDPADRTIESAPTTEPSGPVIADSEGSTSISEPSLRRADVR